MCPEWYSSVRTEHYYTDSLYLELQQSCAKPSIYKEYMHVTVNNDFFWSRVGWFVNDFLEWRSHERKYNHWQITSRVTRKSLFTVTHALFNECIILFLTRYFISWIHRCATKQSSIAHFAIVARDDLFWLNIVTSSQLICDVPRTRGTDIVTSYSSIVLARAIWRKGDLR